MNGSPLPPCFNHVPFSSFSSESRPVQEVSPAPPPYVPQPLAEPAYSEEDLSTVVESVTREAVSVSVEEVARECVLQEKQLMDEVSSLVCVSIMGDLVSEVIRSESQELAQKVVLEALEVKAIKDKIADSVVVQTVNAVLSVETSEIVQSVYW